MAAATSLFPPFTTVRPDSSGQYYFYSWRDTGVFDRMMDPKSPLVALRTLVRAESGRDLEPTAAIIDSQSVKTTDPKSPTLVILELLEKAPTVKKLFADSAYAGPKLAGKLKALGLSELLEFVTKPEGKTRRVRL